MKLARLWPLGLLALYLATPNRQYQFDALDYATAARTGGALFHPHHLVYNALGWLLCRLGGEPLRVLATANAIITVAAAVMLAQLIRAHTGSFGLARAGGIGYGLTHGAWYMATAVEVYPASILGELGALSLALRGSMAAAAGAGVCSAVGMLFHQTALFSVPPTAWLLYKRGGAARAVGYLAVAGGLTVGAYLIVALREDHATPAAFVRWLTAYAHSTQFSTGTWGGGFQPAKMAGAALGIIGTFVFPSFVWSIRPFSDFRPGVWELAPLALSAASVLLFVVIVVRARKAGPTDDHDRDLRRALAVWVLVHAAFTVWWENVNFEFWLMALAPATLWLALRLSAAVTVPSLPRLAWIALALFGAGNLLATFIPDAESKRNGWLTIVGVLNAQAHDGDILYSNEPAVDGYNRYFGHHQVRIRSIRDTGGEQTAVAALATEVDAARARGAAWLLETETVDEFAGVPAAMVKAFWTSRMTNATVAGHYFAWGRSWRIWRLAPSVAP